MSVASDQNSMSRRRYRYYGDGWCVMPVSRCVMT